LLLEHQVPTCLLDGDDLREGLNADLGFSEKDRVENVRRLGEVAILFAEFGYITIVSAISPYLDSRRAVRERHRISGLVFVEVHVATPLAVCEARDPKGHYALARRGDLPFFTGVSAPYERPESPELRLETNGSPEEAAGWLLVNLKTTGLLIGNGTL
jgi:bifunctional enzyme CysN/CysC